MIAKGFEETNSSGEGGGRERGEGVTICAISHTVYSPPPRALDWWIPVNTSYTRVYNEYNMCVLSPDLTQIDTNYILFFFICFLNCVSSFFSCYLIFFSFFFNPGKIMNKSLGFIYEGRLYEIGRSILAAATWGESWWS